jgi:hypothetical protein
MLDRKRPALCCVPKGDRLACLPSGRLMWRRLVLWSVKKSSGVKLVRIDPLACNEPVKNERDVLRVTHENLTVHTRPLLSWMDEGDFVTNMCWAVSSVLV